MQTYTFTEEQLLHLLTDTAEATLCQLGTMRRSNRVYDAIGMAVADAMQELDTRAEENNSTAAA